MPPNEFLDDRIGELPAELDHESEFPGVSTTAPGARAPATGARPQRYSVSPSAEAPPHVTSVYGTRPPLSREFSIQLVYPEVGGMNPGNLRGLGFTVPLGYVAVLRDVDYFIDPLPAGPSDSDFLLTIVTDANFVFPTMTQGELVVNNPASPVPYYSNIRVGPALASPLPIHLVVGPGRVVGANLGVSVALGVGPFEMFMRFHGEFLLATGQLPDMEIASRPRSQARTPPRFQNRSFVRRS